LKVSIIQDHDTILIMNFNRYWISDKSGMGREKWVYFGGQFDSPYEAFEHVRDRYESWAQDPDDYRFRIELNVALPPGMDVKC